MSTQARLEKLIDDLLNDRDWKIRLQMYEGFDDYEHWEIALKEYFDTCRGRLAPIKYGAYKFFNNGECWNMALDLKTGPYLSDLPYDWFAYFKACKYFNSGELWEKILLTEEWDKFTPQEQFKKYIRLATYEHFNDPLHWKRAINDRCKFIVECAKVHLDTAEYWKRGPNYKPERDKYWKKKLCSTNPWEELKAYEYFNKEEYWKIALTSLHDWTRYRAYEYFGYFKGACRNFFMEEETEINWSPYKEMAVGITSAEYRKMALEDSLFLIRFEMSFYVGKGVN